MVLGRRLGEPDVTTITAEVAGLEGFSDVFLDDDGATGGVDEPGAYSVLMSKLFLCRRV
jgi:hypothetical protein